MADNSGKNVLQKALERRAALQAEIQEIEIFIAMYQRIGGGWAGESIDSFESATKSTDSEQTRRPGMPQKDFGDYIVQLCIANGRPMFGADILAKIHENGRFVGGTNETSNFKTKLWRAKDEKVVTLIPGAGYWPTDRPCAAVGYVPPPSPGTWGPQLTKTS